MIHLRENSTKVRQILYAQISNRVCPAATNCNLQQEWRFRTGYKQT